MFLFVRVDNTKLDWLCHWGVYIWCEKPSASRVPDKRDMVWVWVSVRIWSKIEYQEYINSICRFFFFFISRSVTESASECLCLYAILVTKCHRKKSYRAYNQIRDNKMEEESMQHTITHNSFGCDVIIFHLSIRTILNRNRFALSLKCVKKNSNCCH